MIPKVHNPNWDFFCLNGVVQAITSSKTKLFTPYTSFKLLTLCVKKKKALFAGKKMYFEGLMQKLIRFLYKL